MINIHIKFNGSVNEFEAAMDNAFSINQVNPHKKYMIVNHDDYETTSPLAVDAIKMPSPEELVNRQATAYIDKQVKDWKLREDGRVVIGGAAYEMFDLDSYTKKEDDDSKV